MGHFGRAALLAGILAIASLALAGTPALAALSHSTVEKQFSVGPGCETIADIAVVESTGTVYVVCTNTSLQSSIRKFDLNGNPVNFAGSGPDIGGNEITGSPTSSTRALGGLIAVDNSDAHNGFIYVVSGSYNSPASTNVDVFNPNGEWISAIPTKGAFESRTDVDVGPDGSIYVSYDAFVPHIAKYDTSFHEVARIYGVGGSKFLRVNSVGAVWSRSGVLNDTQISRYDADQFSTNLGVGFGSPAALVKSVQGTPSPLFPDPLLKAPDLKNFDVDLTNDDLYVDRGNHIETYSAGTADEVPHQNAPSFGAGTLAASQAVAVTGDRHVYASTAGAKVVKFGPGDILPDIATPKVPVDDITHTSVLVKANVDPAGGADITSCQVEYGKDTTYKGAGSGVVPCVPDPAGGPFAVATDVSAELPNLTMGAVYHYRFVAGNVHGTNAGLDRTVVPAFVLRVKTLAANEVADHSAVLQGSFDPDGVETSFHFEYGVDDDYGLSTPEEGAGGGSGVTTVEKEIANLPAGKVWHYRIVATNEDGTTYGEDRVFKTAGAPDVSGLRASEVGATSAMLNARIDPVGYDTDYRFEYGTTPEYGHVAPVPNGQIAAGGGAVDVAQRVAGLEPGVTYHFRLTATNKWGSSVSPDTTLDFSPPRCPNDHVRQLTASSYLPDCRAYELVSPANAGAVQLTPSKATQDLFQNSPYGERNTWVVNSGFASSPSRLTYFSNSGVVNGLDGPNNKLDMYLSTRTNAGWVTALPGLRGSVTARTGRKECAQSLNLCLDHDEGAGSSSAPYLFTADGEARGRLPSNLAAIPGGEGFTGAQRMSGDFSHFLFSSLDVAFTPTGVRGGQGSAYDNDLSAHTVTVISKLPNGADIPLDGGSSHAIEFPGVSPDGSHVLMQTPASNGQSHLYMRVDRAITYDVSQGAGVKFIGVTGSGSKVFFISAQQLTNEDEDTSKDIYMWTEVGDGEGKPLTLVSRGNGQGNTDQCNASWTEACGVAPLATERLTPAGLVSVPGLDDRLAEDAGDVYFYSPELLDPVDPGIPGQRNLYVYHGGSVQLVGTLEPGTDVNRIQISPDGRHAALVTASHLTSYDSKGFRQMYVYDADRGEVLCASCNPNALPPTADVEASEGGRFMTDDGRAFFATKDALVPRDNNGEIIDVYEYVGGRPQLISSGFGARDFTGGGVYAILSTPEFIGLEGVSRDGSDVYFTTFDTLVAQDRNGATVKFYDARTGGGFAPPSELAPCAAADECHGSGTEPVPASAIATAGGIAGGNAVTPNNKPAKAKKKKAKKKKSGRRHRRHRHG
jgi:hypothetical protein